MVKKPFHQSRISTLKTHDRLFEVANDERRDARPLQQPQQTELERVRVLKLIDDQAVHPFRQCGQRTSFGRQDHMGRRNHVGVIDEGCFAFVRRVSLNGLNG